MTDWQREIHRLQREPPHEVPHDGPTATCRVCGTRFRLRPMGGLSRRVCSDRCSRTWAVERSRRSKQRRKIRS
jgi:predicted nucleic acid-binding Zn ribbon protein